MNTLMLQRLREYLSQTTREEFLRDWDKIKLDGARQGPTARELIRSFRYTPVYQFKESSFVGTEGIEATPLTFELDERSSSLSFAA